MATVVILIWALITILNAQNIPVNIYFTILECGAFEEYQLFEKINSSNNIAFKFKYFDKTCMDCRDCVVGGQPWTRNCGNTQQSQYYNLINTNNNNTMIQSIVSNENTCLQYSGSYSFAYIQMAICNKTNINQQWIISPDGYIISSLNKSLCLTVESPSILPNCTKPPNNMYPYCNQNIPTEQRVNDLVSRMSLTEKILNLQNRNSGVARLGVPHNIFREALHGVNCGCIGNKCPTSFPHALLLGATFNRTLWAQIGAAISTEARAFANIQGLTGLFFNAPNINLLRDPRWGRGQEVPGEDPYLTGQYVMEFGRNFQYGEDEKYLKAVPITKHYADYDQEGNYGIGRMSFNANVSMQDQVEYYWPAWRTAIQSGGIQGIMCSYNAVNNLPSCGNDYFINQVARDEWGYDGFVYSDCSAIGDGAFTQYVKTQYPNASGTEIHLQTVRIAIEGGCDVNCGNKNPVYAQYLQESVENGITSENDIDIASKRLWKQVFNLGKLDYNPPSYYTTYGADKIDCIQHRNIAQTAAEQGIVLLKNENNLLPLSKTSVSGKSIAIIGPHANSTRDLKI
eukprot:446130_1